MSSKTDNFINKIYPHAVEDMKQSGVLASLTIAQAILESGWGESRLAQEGNNLFGIKKGDGWNGKTISLNGSQWRVYDSWLGGIQDHSKLLQKPRYAKVIQTKDYKVACEEVRLAGYCTESDYSQKLIRLIEQYDLAKYDVVETEEFIPYRVVVICDSLAIREKDSFGSCRTGYVHKGEVFTIVGESNGLLKLKSGKGWISANQKYIKKMK